MPAPEPTIIHGSNGVATVKINALDYQCVLSNWTASATKQYMPQTFFCSGGYVDEMSGFKQVLGAATGALSKYEDISDPLLDFDAMDGVPVILQADEGCFVNFTGHIEKDLGVVAGGNSSFGVRYRSKGTVGRTWALTEPA